MFYICKHYKQVRELILHFVKCLFARLVYKQRFNLVFDEVNSFKTLTFRIQIHSSV